MAALGACDAGSSVVVPGEPGTVDNTTNDDGTEVGSGSLAIRFEAPLDRGTSCGTAEGIRVQVANASGAVQSCDALWAEATISGEMAGGAGGDHQVADCMFVLSSGVWNVQSVDALDANGNPLTCCDASYPQSVNVQPSQTTEFGAAINCQTPQSGALDIYAYVNRPPTINNVTISPSKFGRTCDVLTLDADATDGEGDAVGYFWSIAAAPANADVALIAKGDKAYFSSATMGSFDIKLTASDGSLSHHLTFPLHITSQGGSMCNDGQSSEARARAASVP